MQGRGVFLLFGRGWKVGKGEEMEIHTLEHVLAFRLSCCDLGVEAGLVQPKWLSRGLHSTLALLK